MSPRARLREFLADRFSDTEWKTFINDYFEAASDSVAWTEGLDKQTDQFLTWVETHGRVAELWPLLREQRPTFLDDIAKLERDWKAAQPSALTRWIPAALRTSRLLQLGLAGIVVVAGVIVFAIVWTNRPDPVSVVIMLDIEAQAVAGNVEPSPYVLEIEGVKYPIQKRGLSIGKGRTLPESVAVAYHDIVGPAETPTKVDIELTAKLVSKMRITLDAEPCKKQPQILANEDGKWVVHLDDCQ